MLGRPEAESLLEALVEVTDRDTGHAGPPAVNALHRTTPAPQAMGRLAVNSRRGAGHIPSLVLAPLARTIEW